MITDKILLEKYNNPVPRYTSYPPANHFKNDYEPDDYISEILISNTEEPSNISIYIHIPFCKKMCHYCGCNAIKMRNEYQVKQYVQALKKEIKWVCKEIDKSRKVSQIHYGGGTPNAIEVSYLQEINQMLFDTFNFIEQPEIAIECNPAYLTEQYLEGLSEAGFNRYSIGIQDFNKNILDIVNRAPSSLPLDKITSLLKEKNPLVAINFDFIYGLPGQTVESFSESISKAISYHPDRLVTFSYAHVPWVNKAQKILEKSGLPKNSEKLKMFEASYQNLVTNGYKMIGFDHYAKENDELSVALQNGQLHRNFQGYCTKRTTGQVYAFGVSGISQLNSLYVQNEKAIDVYIQKINNGNLPVVKGYKLNRCEKIVREVINELMCNKTFNFSQLEKKLDISKKELCEIIVYDEAVLKAFHKEGIIQLNSKGFTVPDEGLLFIRNVAASLDPLMKNNTKSYSKPV